MKRILIYSIVQEGVNIFSLKNIDANVKFLGDRND